jgi:hypothetical protein
MRSIRDSRRVLAATALDEANAGQVLKLAPLLAETISRLGGIACANPPGCPDPIIRNRSTTLLDRLDVDNDRPGLTSDREDYWINEWIRPGVFRMGDTYRIGLKGFIGPTDVDNSHNDEWPDFDYTIRRAYKLARYPATNRQYEEFLKTLDEKGSSSIARPSGLAGATARARATTRLSACADVSLRSTCQGHRLVVGDHYVRSAHQSAQSVQSRPKSADRSAMRNSASSLCIIEVGRRTQERRKRLCLFRRSERTRIEVLRSF